MENPTDHTLEELGELLGIPNLGGEDWDLVFANPNRVSEFCDAYESGSLSPMDKAAIMQLIVASYDQRSKDEPPDDELEARIYRSLTDDFDLHKHTIEYWSKLKSHNPDVLWKVSPLMRRILSERGSITVVFED